MSHGLKALLLAASTIITCIIVGLGFRMAQEAKLIGNHVVDKLYQYRTAVEEQDYTKYDGATVYGNDVINLMKAELTGKKNGVKITVTDEITRNSYEREEDIEKVQEFGTIYYIAPTAEYRGSIVRNKNEVIVELVFQKKQEDKNE